MNSNNKKEEKNETQIGTELGHEGADTTVNQADREMTTEEKVAYHKKQSKELVEKLKKEKADNKVKAAEDKIVRDQELLNEADFLKSIQKLIHGYNKLGKGKRSEHNVIGRIHNMSADYLEEKARSENLVAEE